MADESIEQASRDLAEHEHKRHAALVLRQERVWAAQKEYDDAVARAGEEFNKAVMAADERRTKALDAATEQAKEALG